MIAKAGLVVAAAIVAVIGGRAVDLRGLYDQMYPVSTLKRDVLNLCVESDPAFIRALHDQREACYFRMPHTIAVALGLVRPNTALEGLFSPWNRLPGAGTLLSDAGLGTWAAAFRQPPRDLRVGSLPCRPAGDPDGLAELSPQTLTDQTARSVLAGRPGKLAALGLSPPTPSLTVLPAPSRPARQGAPPAVGAAIGGVQPNSLILFDTAAAADLGDKTPLSGPPATGCSARI